MSTPVYCGGPGNVVPASYTVSVPAITFTDPNTGNPFTEDAYTDTLSPGSDQCNFTGSQTCTVTHYAGTGGGRDTWYVIVSFTIEGEPTPQYQWEAGPFYCPPGSGPYALAWVDVNTPPLGSVPLAGFDVSLTANC